MNIGPVLIFGDECGTPNISERSEKNDIVNYSSATITLQDINAASSLAKDWIALKARVGRWGEFKKFESAIGAEKLIILLPELLNKYSVEVSVVSIIKDTFPRKQPFLNAHFIASQAIVGNLGKSDRDELIHWDNLDPSTASVIVGDLATKSQEIKKNLNISFISKKTGGYERSLINLCDWIIGPVGRGYAIGPNGPGFDSTRILGIDKCQKLNIESIVAIPTNVSGTMNFKNSFGAIYKQYIPCDIVADFNGTAFSACKYEMASSHEVEEFLRRRGVSTYFDQSRQRQVLRLTPEYLVKKRCWG